MGNQPERPACDVARRHVGSLPCPPYAHTEDDQSPAVRARCRAFPMRDARRPLVGATRRPRSPVNSTALRHWLDAHAHVAAHHLPYRDLARIGHSQTAFSDVPGYKDPAAFSPRAQEPSHGRAAAPPMKTHGELHPPAACTANACCSCLT
jgi:hypothetical protein